MADKNIIDTDLNNDTEPATGHDVGIGGGLGAVGGAIVGALAGGPVGAIVGAIVGAGASAAAVDVVDKHDHDYERTVGHADTTTPAYTAEPGLADTTAGTATGYTGAGDYARTQAVTPVESDYASTAPMTAAVVGTDTDRSVELHAEELHATTQAVQTGEVTLRKEVITETKTIDVPVTREEVVIERHAVTGAAATANAAFGAVTDEVIRVPVMEEQVTVQKTPVVTEEISLGKRQVTETQHVTDTVRHEEAYIENPDSVDVLDRSGRAS